MGEAPESTACEHVVLVGRSQDEVGPLRGAVAGLEQPAEQGASDLQFPFRAQRIAECRQGTTHRDVDARVQNPISHCRARHRHDLVVATAAEKLEHVREHRRARVELARLHHRRPRVEIARERASPEERPKLNSNAGIDDGT
jgi:hypothetical protein